MGKRKHHSKETIEKIRAKAIGRYKGMTFEERYGIERAKEIRKKPIGFKYMQINNPKRFLELQSKRGTKGGTTTQKRHPETRNRVKEWTLKNLDKKTCSLGGITTSIKHPEIARNNTIRFKSKESRIRASNQMKKRHIKYPDLASRAGIIGNIKHPYLARERGLKSIEAQSQKGFVSKPEKIMKQLLPIDFIHGKRLGNVGVPDFHSPERKIVVEVDGVYWHSKQENIKRDKAQTAYWKKMGYQIFRITDLDVNKYMKPMLKC